MPSVSPPFVLPPSLNFYCNDETSLTQRVCIYNPYAFDILYKVDNATPKKFSLNIQQGVVSSRKKLYLDMTCHHKEISQDDRIQIRFYKWPRPRLGGKPRSQQYIGFREIRLFVYNNVSEREGTPSWCSDSVSTIGASSCITNNPGPSSPAGSDAYPCPGQQLPSGANSSHDRNPVLAAHHKWQVWTNLCLTIVLLLLGFLLNKADPDWFSTNVLDGVEPHTMAVVSYTLAVVLIIKLLTYR